MSKAKKMKILCIFFSIIRNLEPLPPYFIPFDYASPRFLLSFY